MFVIFYKEVCKFENPTRKKNKNKQHHGRRRRRQTRETIQASGRCGVVCSTIFLLLTQLFQYSPQILRIDGISRQGEEAVE